MQAGPGVGHLRTLKCQRLLFIYLFFKNKKIKHFLKLKKNKNFLFLSLLRLTNKFSILFSVKSLSNSAKVEN